MSALEAHHDGTPDLFLRDETSFRVRIEIRGAEATGVALRTEPDNESHLVPMQRIEKSAGRSLYEAELTLDPSSGVTRYCFRIATSDGRAWLAADGLRGYLPERAFHFRFVHDYRPAAWVWEQIFYQIFPDRFRDGDPSNNVRSGEYRYQDRPVVARTWGELPDPTQGAREFYGGDLQGVEQGLDHLQALGVSAVYLNPIFASPSSHKYDTVDYHRVDPHLGGDEALQSLTAALRERGMRLILDAVVNHTSERHPWFDRYGEHGGGAYGDPASSHRDRYVFGDAGSDRYVGWKGVRTLPVLDFDSPQVIDDFVAGPDAVLRRWLRPPYRIDGWRLDVIHMLGSGAGARDNADHVRAFRRAIREERDDAYLLGEHFAEATPWLQGDQEDGAMNYHGFTRPLQRFLSQRDPDGSHAPLDAAEFDRWLAGARGQLPFAIQLSQLNLLDSHDTPRMLTHFGGDAELLRVAATAQLAYIGVPCLYYGDEIGLEGGHDPDCRRTFPWDERRWDHTTLNRYRHLIRVRRERPELRRGGFRTLHAEGSSYAFARTLAGAVSVCVLHRGGRTTIDLGLADRWPDLRWRDALDGSAADGVVVFDGVGARHLVSDRAAD
jgi:alpha-glucosidase